MSEERNKRLSTHAHPRPPRGEPRETGRLPTQQSVLATSLPQCLRGWQEEFGTKRRVFQWRDGRGWGKDTPSTLGHNSHSALFSLSLSLRTGHLRGKGGDTRLLPCARTLSLSLSLSLSVLAVVLMSSSLLGILVLCRTEPRGARVLEMLHSLRGMDWQRSAHFF